MAHGWCSGCRGADSAWKVLKCTELHTFKILPARWGVERTFGWLSNCRRLAKDYEFRTENSEAMILIAATRLMLRRIV